MVKRATRSPLVGPLAARTIGIGDAEESVTTTPIASTSFGPIIRPKYDNNCQLKDFLEVKCSSMYNLYDAGRHHSLDGHKM